MVSTYFSSIKAVEDEGSSFKHTVVTPSPVEFLGKVRGNTQRNELEQGSRFAAYGLCALVELPDLANTIY